MTEARTPDLDLCRRCGAGRRRHVDNPYCDACLMDPRLSGGWTDVSTHGMRG